MLKRILFSLCAVLLCHNLLISQKTLTSVSKFGDNPGNLKMYMYVPEKIAKSEEPRPLVVVLHGCSQSAESIAEASGWNHLAERNEFFVLYPETNVKNNLSSCFNWFQPANNMKDEGELASIMNMIAQAQKTYKIDPENICVYGVSAGAGLAMALMANYPSKFNAGATIAGVPYGIANNAIKATKAMGGQLPVATDALSKYITDCNPQYKGDYPKIIVMQGMKDPVVEPSNADHIIQQWIPLHHVDSTQVKTEENFNENADVTKYTYSNEYNVPCLIYYQINNIGHRIPTDSSEPTADSSTGAGYFTRDKNFFSTYWIAKEMGLVGE